MTQYVNSDMDLGEIASCVLQEYFEPVTGSTPMPLDLIYDKINSVYQDIFNEPQDLSYYREKTFTFQTVADDFVNQPGGISPGDVTIVLNNSASFPNAARTILVGNNDFVNYTNNNTGTNTLTGVTGIDVAQADQTPVRLSYPISSIPNIDEQQIVVIWINGREHKYEPPHLFFDTTRPHYLKFTIVEGNIYLCLGSGGYIATMIYYQSPTLMDDVSDKPSLIPGKFRYGLLVEGTITKIGVRDDLRTGWDWHQQEFKDAKKKFFAFGNNRVRTKGPNMRPSVYDQ